VGFAKLGLSQRSGAAKALERQNAAFVDAERVRS